MSGVDWNSHPHDVQITNEALTIQFIIKNKTRFGIFPNLVLEFTILNWHAYNSKGYKKFF